MVASTFHQFGLLPAELRLKIWNYSTEHHDIIIWLTPHTFVRKVQESPDDNLGMTTNYYRTPKHKSTTKWLTSTPTPNIIKSLSETCKESYEYLQENCPVWENVYRCPLSKKTGLRCKLDQTTVYLRLSQLHTEGGMNKNLEQMPKQAKLSRSLIIEYVRAGVHDIDPVLDIFYTFPMLKYLVIITSYDWSFLGAILAFDNTFGNSKVEEQLLEIDEAIFDDIRKAYPGWKMPLVKGLESGGNHSWIDTMYYDIFPQPSDPKWTPFRRMDSERKWHDVEES